MKRWEEMSERELDALVAEHVMSVRPPTEAMRKRGVIFVPKHYSADISAAMEVVEKTIEDTRCRFQCGYGRGIKGSSGWYAFFGDPGGASGRHPESLPTAICLAALRAKGVEV